MLLYLDFSIFRDSVKKWKIEFFEYKPKLYFHIFRNSQRDFKIFECYSSWTKTLRNWDVSSLLEFVFCQIVSIVFQAQYVCRSERGPNLWLNGQFLRKKVRVFI